MNNVPMSNPEMMLACHKPFTHTRGACIALRSGRIAVCSGKSLGYSDDGGMTWSDPMESLYPDGEAPNIANLVELSDGTLGGVAFRSGSNYRHDLEPTYNDPAGLHKTQGYFSVLEDWGKTWSAPAPMLPGYPMPATAFQNALIRTSSGRLLQPVYFAIGKGRWHQPGAPFAGGWADGEFTTTDAHYYDPHFGGSYVIYSDDEGKSWQPNRDGELFILPEYGGRQVKAMEPSVVEVESNKLLMFLRSQLGRVFQSWSYDNGETWSHAQPTQLAASNSPDIVTKLPSTGHLLAVWNQHGEREIRQGYIRTRLSAAVSRNGGGIWEFFQNVESLHEQRHVEPGPIRITQPEGAYAVHAGLPAHENESEYVVELDEGYDRWTNHSVCALKDRVLIIYGGRCKILTIDWFYRGRDSQSGDLRQTSGSSLLKKLQDQCPPL